MGKNWRGPRKGGFGGKNTNSDNSIGSCKGHGIIMATCDSARERETNKEIVTLVDMILEEWEASGKIDRLPEAESTSLKEDRSKDESIADILAAEIAEAQKEAKGFKPKNSRIINTNIKGVVIVKVMRQGCCPVEIVRAIFEKVKGDRKAYSRHIVRMIPLRYCFYPDEWDLVENVRKCVDDTFPGLQLPPTHFTRPKDEREKRLVAQRASWDGKEGGDAEGATGGSSDTIVAVDAHSEECTDSNKREREGSLVDEGTATKVKRTGAEGGTTTQTITTEAPATAVAYAPFSYKVAFKARNHNILDKAKAMDYVKNNMPAAPMTSPAWQNPDVSTMTVVLTLHTHAHPDSSSSSWRRVDRSTTTGAFCR
jgi:hypothetical protein